jgi:uncharacterized protein
MRGEDLQQHDAYRVNKGGSGSFDQVMRGWELLRRQEVDVNFLCTIHAANADHPIEVYRFFRDQLQTKFMQFIPIVERTTEDFLPLANLGWGERPGADRPLYTQHGGKRKDCGRYHPARSIISISLVFHEYLI